MLLARKSMRIAPKQSVKIYMHIRKTNFFVSLNITINKTPLKTITIILA